MSCVQEPVSPSDAGSVWYPCAAQSLSANSSAADLISGDLASGEKGGYKYTMQITPVGYTVNANPTAFNNTGSRTFYSDQSLTIRQNFGVEPATAASPEIK